MNNLTNEMLQKAKESKTADELLNLAKENDYSLTEEQATEKFDEWNKTGELADEELENVAAGGTYGVDIKDLYIGQNVGLWDDFSTQQCETCHSERYIVVMLEKEKAYLRCVNGCAFSDYSSTRCVERGRATITD